MLYSLSIFISYARSDSSNLVDQLELDLRAYGYHTWVDRAKIKGGQVWLDELEKSIQQCQAMLVVLSEKSVDSKYVRMEYRYAQQLGKQIIPLESKDHLKIPIDLSSLHRINFKAGYEQGLKDLLATLHFVEGGTDSIYLSALPVSLPSIPPSPDDFSQDLHPRYPGTGYPKTHSKSHLRRIMLSFVEWISDLRWLWALVGSLIAITVATVSALPRLPDSLGIFFAVIAITSFFLFILSICKILLS